MITDNCHKHNSAAVITLVIPHGRAVSDSAIQEFHICSECGAIYLPPDQIEAFLAKETERLLRERQQHVEDRYRRQIEEEKEKVRAYNANRLAKAREDAIARMGLCSPPSIRVIDEDDAQLRERLRKMYGK